MMTTRHKCRIDTHRHLGGSLSTQFVWDTIQRLDLHFLAESHEEVVSQMTFINGESPGFHRFLEKFKILDEMPWNEELIDQSVLNVCKEIERERIDYALLDFSINKYMRLKWHKHQAIQFIYDAFEKYLPNRVGLILSIKYESLKASQRQYAKLIENPDVANALVGIDLVGNEATFNADDWSSLLQPWAKAGKMVRAHVGEYGPAVNVRDAIEKLGVTNIAHGIKIVDDVEIVKLAKDRNIYFDLGLSSNTYTGVVNDVHPIGQMVEHGLLITLGTDDPIICNTTLDDELALAEKYGISSQLIDIMQQNAIDNVNRFEKCRKQLNQLGFSNASN